MYQGAEKILEEMDIINPIKGSLSKGSDVAVDVAYFKINSRC